MEQNRLWHEPVVEIYANAISPGVSCSARAYDLANRRWYELNVSDALSSSEGGTNDEDNERSAIRTFQVPEDDWLSSTVAKHVSDYFKSTGSPPTWNIINTTSTGQPVAFEQAKNDYYVGMPILESFSYGHKSLDQLPTIDFRDLRNKMYLSRGADYCDWKGDKCVFKRIEFDCDNESHENEIRAREHLIQQIDQESGATPIDVNNEMLRRFNVVPILGVVLHDETSQWMIRTRQEFAVDEDEENIEEDDGPQEVSVIAPEDAMQPGHIVAGFITPYMGRSLELFGAARPSMGVESPKTHLPSLPALGTLTTTVDMPITKEQLLDLVKGVGELSRCGTTHGDICYWNIILQESAPPYLSVAPRLLLIDMGDTAPDYENDAVALAGVLLWCLNHSTRLREDTTSRNKVIVASALLKEGDFDGAIGVLSLASMPECGYKSKAPYSNDAQQAKRRRIEPEDLR
ncbi:hypothetical protein J7T55_003214 [Diaporthe amygdali]|uniref:uncharacterized protein n=1 Tax=Phomopsis amygdali TaxID=1214568 RepID=UPI0022FE7F90|nr:uncharacterized protein J7T55_003214 [Diaporthe amygdali]KAJ0122698.1 hypothetical protein J7T55_003214 [Diaporthe amygdali]